MTDTTTTIRSQILTTIVTCSVFVGAIVVGLLVVVASVGSVSAIATHDSESFVTNDVTEANSDAIDATMDVGGNVTVQSLTSDTQGTLTIQTAPSSSSLDTVTNVSAAAVDDQTIAIDDALILRLSSTELSNAIASGNGSSGTNAERLLELEQSGDIDIDITQTNDDDAKRLDLGATVENGGLKVLHAGSVLYIVIDTERAEFKRGEQTVDAAPDDQFEVTVTGNETSVSADFEIEPRAASFDTTDDQGTIAVKAETNQTVSGETTVAPGTYLTIRAQSDKRSSFVITRTTSVESDGTFDLDFDFTNVTKGTSFDLTIPNQGFEDNASTAGIVQRPSTASVSVNNQNIGANETQTIVVRSVNLSEGGFITVHDRSFFDTENETKPAQSLRGAKYIRPGLQNNTSIELDIPYKRSGTVVVVPYHDTNGNHELDITTGDEPYVGADGGPIANSANASVGDGIGQGTTTELDPQNETVPSVPSPVNGTDDYALPNGSDGTGTHALDGATGSNEDGERGDESNIGNKKTTLKADGTTETDGPGFGLAAGVVAIGVITLLSAHRTREN
nr:BGTF surface domain-containing protein [Halocatena marina]